MLAMKAGKIVIGLAAIAVLVFLCVPQGRAGSSSNQITARLTGFQEVPANLSAGQGTFSAQIINEETIQFEFSYQDLSGAPTMAHIHLGQRAVNGPVIAFLCGGPKAACPEGPATITGTITAADIMAQAPQNLAAGDLAAAIRAIRHGVTYVNVHTPNSPAGEIRGQVRPDVNLSGFDG